MVVDGLVVVGGLVVDGTTVEVVPTVEVITSSEQAARGITRRMSAITNDKTFFIAFDPFCFGMKMLCVGYFYYSRFFSGRKDVFAEKEGQKLI